MVAAYTYIPAKTKALGASALALLQCTVYMDAHFTCHEAESVVSMLTLCIVLCLYARILHVSLVVSHISDLIPTPVGLISRINASALYSTLPFATTLPNSRIQHVLRVL